MAPSSLPRHRQHAPRCRPVACVCSLAVALYALRETHARIAAATGWLGPASGSRLLSLGRGSARRRPLHAASATAASTAPVGTEVAERAPAHELLKTGGLRIEDFELELRGVPPSSLYYVPDFITPETEDALRQDVDEAGSGMRWTQVLDRRMQSFGAPGPLPPFLERLAEGMRSCGAVPAQYHPNHCLVNDYARGKGIGAHSDPDYFGPHVAIFSLLDTTAMYFVRTQPYSMVQPRHRIVLAPRSMLVFRGEMYSNWTHEIQELTEDSLEDIDWRQAGAPEPTLRRRLSLTLRRWM